MPACASMVQTSHHDFSTHLRHIEFDSPLFSQKMNSVSQNPSEPSCYALVCASSMPEHTGKKQQKFRKREARRNTSEKSTLFSLTLI